MAKNLKLKLARVELDLTQGQLADAVGVTRQTIGLIEAGKYNPSLSLCQSICRCLGKTLDQLSPLKELLDGFVLSCDIKAIKPDLAMFKEILDKYQLDPVNCVFLDDIEDNTIAAEKLGIKAYQVKKRSDVVDILKSYI